MCGMYVAPQIVTLLPSCSIVVCKHPVIDWARRTQLPCPLGCALSASPPRCLQGMLSLVGLPKIRSASKLCHLVSAASVDAAMYQHSPACCLQRLLPNKHPLLIRYCVLLITIPLLPAECPVCGGPVTVPHMQPCPAHPQAPVCCLQRVLSAVGLSKAQPGSKRKAELDEPADTPAPAAAPGAGAEGPAEAALEEPTAARRPRGRPRKRQRRTSSPPVQVSPDEAHSVRLLSGTTQEPTQAPEQMCLSPAQVVCRLANRPGVLHVTRKRLCKHQRRPPSHR